VHCSLQYALQPVTVDPVTSLSVGVVQCIPCRPGTWNTCIRINSCDWCVFICIFLSIHPSLLHPHDTLFLCRTIPEEGGARNLGLFIHSSGSGPLGSCYSCDAVSRHKMHYIGMASPRKSEVDLNKAWICPGEDAAPRNCLQSESSPAALVASPDKSTCVCANGWYGTEKTGCTLCEAGHYCVGGERIPCKDHHYQANTGQSACERCTSTGEADGTPVYNCGSGRLLIQCQTSKPKTQNQTLSNGCFPCNQCRRPYISGAVVGLNDCYG
jgi:hypothetical protein